MIVSQSRLRILNVLAEDADACCRCGLQRTRNKVVFGEGNPEADIMFVGEAPGADEDESGRPFVGRAGKLLNSMIESMGLTREDVYICNTLKCRPPGNRNPTDDEQESCRHFLHDQIAIISPICIVALGNPALAVLTGNGKGITKRCGKWEKFDYQNRYGEQSIPVMPCFHPSAMLRNPDWKEPSWHALQEVMRSLKEWEKL